MFAWEEVDDLLDTNSKGVGLLSVYLLLSFKDFQHMDYLRFAVEKYTLKYFIVFMIVLNVWGFFFYFTGRKLCQDIAIA